ncbi:Tn7 transposase TnsA N-terminal domain-containing protein [Roseateles sp. P5_E11]
MSKHHASKPPGAHARDTSGPLMRGPIVAIRYPEEGKPRARKVISRSKATSSGKYPSWKAKRMLHWESPHELHAFRLLDAHASVLRFAEQPLVVTYVMDGVQHDHYPDIEVQTASGRELWEVKTRADAERFAQRTRLLQEALPSYGYRYRVVLAEDLAAEPRLSNAALVLRHGRPAISDLARERARLLLDRQPVLSWGVILDGAFGAEGHKVACRLLLEGQLLLDVDAPIGRSTILRRPGVGGAVPGPLLAHDQTGVSPTMSTGGPNGSRPL